MVGKTKEESKKLMQIMRKLKRKSLKQYYRFEAKYRYVSLYLFSKFFVGVELFTALLILLSVLYLTNILDLPFFNYVFDNLPTLSTDINRQLVFAQLSITFIITSLFSLIITLKKEKVLGTSIYIITFAKSIFGNLILFSLTVFSMLFLNIFLYLKGGFPEVILPIFLITLGIFSFFILKMILFTNSLKISTDKIGSIYLWENRKIIRKGVKKGFTQNFKDSKYLSSLNEDTLEKILKQDKEYLRNFYALERVTNLALHNYKLEVQEYHLHWKDTSDSIIYWINAIQELLRMELYADALNQYIRLLGLFIRHEVYISSFSLKDLLEQIFSGISEKKSKSIFDQNKKQMLIAMQSTMQYTYYKINNDLSYTRFGKLKRVLPASISDNFLVEYYNIINKKLGLVDLEKSDELKSYFEEIRLMSHEITRLNHDNVSVVKNNEMFENLLASSGNLNLLGNPLSQLIIVLIQEKRDGGILHFLKYFNNDTIYYSCLIIATKLTKLYFYAEPHERKEIEDNLKMILIKLVEWDDYKIKINCKQLTQEVEAIYFERTYAHSNNSLMTHDLEYLSIVKQSVMMRRKEVDVENIEFSSEKLGEISKLLSKVDKDILDKMQNELEIEFKERFGVLYLL